MVLAAGPQKVRPHQSGGARGCAGDPVRHDTQGEAIEVRGPNIAPKVGSSLRLLGVARHRSAASIVRFVVYVLEVVPLGEFLDVAADYAELGEGVGGDNSAVRSC